jgi:hypothetical protein
VSPLGKVFSIRDYTRDVSDRFIIQRFTGVKDSVGVDIYEGDIVKTDPKHITVSLCDVSEYTHGEVRWFNSSFKVCQEFIGAAYLNDYVTCNCCGCGLTIIGNVFNTPYPCE